MNMNTMLKTKLTAGLLLALSSNMVSADIGLSVNQMNVQLDECYLQTQRASNPTLQHKLLTTSCTRVINNEWLSKEAESNARLNRGIIYKAKGDTLKAKKDFTWLLRKGVHLYQANIVLAQILEAENDYVLALKHYDSALAINNSNPVLLSKRAKVAEHIAREKHLQLSMLKSITQHENQ
jgi:tetratricopeptide (TPR) repeat protein